MNNLIKSNKIKKWFKIIRKKKVYNPVFEIPWVPYQFNRNLDKIEDFPWNLKIEGVAQNLTVGKSQHPKFSNRVYKKANKTKLQIHRERMYNIYPKISRTKVDAAFILTNNNTEKAKIILELHIKLEHKNRSCNGEEVSEKLKIDASPITQKRYNTNPKIKIISDTTISSSKDLPLVEPSTDKLESIDFSTIRNLGNSKTTEFSAVDSSTNKVPSINFTQENTLLNISTAQDLNSPETEGKLCVLSPTKSSSGRPETKINSKGNAFSDVYVAIDLRKKESKLKLVDVSQKIKASNLRKSHQNSSASLLATEITTIPSSPKSKKLRNYKKENKIVPIYKNGLSSVSVATKNEHLNLPTSENSSNTGTRVKIRTAQLGLEILPVTTNNNNNINLSISENFNSKDYEKIQGTNNNNNDNYSAKVHTEQKYGHNLQISKGALRELDCENKIPPNTRSINMNSIDLTNSQDAVNHKITRKLQVNHTLPEVTARSTGNSTRSIISKNISRTKKIRKTCVERSQISERLPCIFTSTGCILHGPCKSTNSLCVPYQNSHNSSVESQKYPTIFSNISENSRQISVQGITTNPFFTEDPIRTRMYVDDASKCMSLMSKNTRTTNYLDQNPALYSNQGPVNLPSYDNLPQPTYTHNNRQIVPAVTKRHLTSNSVSFGQPTNINLPYFNTPAISKHTRPTKRLNKPSGDQSWFDRSEDRYLPVNSFNVVPAEDVTLPINSSKILDPLSHAHHICIDSNCQNAFRNRNIQNPYIPENLEGAKIQYQCIPELPQISVKANRTRFTETLNSIEGPLVLENIMPGLPNSTMDVNNNSNFPKHLCFPNDSTKPIIPNTLHKLVPESRENLPVYAPNSDKRPVTKTLNAIVYPKASENVIQVLPNSMLSVTNNLNFRTNIYIPNSSVQSTVLTSIQQVFEFGENLPIYASNPNRKPVTQTSNAIVHPKVAENILQILPNSILGVNNNPNFPNHFYCPNENATLTIPTPFQKTFSESDGRNLPARASNPKEKSGTQTNAVVCPIVSENIMQILPNSTLDVNKTSNLPKHADLSNNTTQLTVPTTFQQIVPESIEILPICEPNPNRKLVTQMPNFMKLSKAPESIMQMPNSILGVNNNPNFSKHVYFPSDSAKLTVSTTLQQIVPEFEKNLPMYASNQKRRPITQTTNAVVYPVVPENIMRILPSSTSSVNSNPYLPKDVYFPNHRVEPVVSTTFQQTFPEYKEDLRTYSLTSSRRLVTQTSDAIVYPKVSENIMQILPNSTLAVNNNNNPNLYKHVYFDNSTVELPTTFQKTIPESKIYASNSNKALVTLTSNGIPECDVMQVLPNSILGDNSNPNLPKYVYYPNNTAELTASTSFQKTIPESGENLPMYTANPNRISVTQTSNAIVCSKIPENVQVLPNSLLSVDNNSRLPQHAYFSNDTKHLTVSPTLQETIREYQGNLPVSPSNSRSLPTSSNSIQHTNHNNETTKLVTALCNSVNQSRPSSAHSDNNKDSRFSNLCNVKENRALLVSHDVIKKGNSALLALNHGAPELKESTMPKNDALSNVPDYFKSSGGIPSTATEKPFKFRLPNVLRHQRPYVSKVIDKFLPNFAQHGCNTHQNLSENTAFEGFAVDNMMLSPLISQNNKINSLNRQPTYYSRLNLKQKMQQLQLNLEKALVTFMKDGDLQTWSRMIEEGYTNALVQISRQENDVQTKLQGSLNRQISRNNSEVHRTGQELTRRDLQSTNNLNDHTYDLSENSTTVSNDFQNETVHDGDGNERSIGNNSRTKTNQNSIIGTTNVFQQISSNKSNNPDTPEESQNDAMLALAPRDPIGQDLSNESLSVYNFSETGPNEATYVQKYRSSESSKRKRATLQSTNSSSAYSSISSTSKNIKMLITKKNNEYVVKYL